MWLCPFVFVAPRSGAQERLDRAPFVHRLVAGCGVVERQLEVEDSSWVDLAVPDHLDQLGQEAAHRGGAAVQMDEAPEQVHRRYLDAMGDADEADVPAGAGGVDRLQHRLLGADRLDDRVRAGPAPAATAPNQPVPSTSEAESRLGIRSSGGISGVATRVPSAKGMRSRSACAPSEPIATRLTQALW